VLFSNAAAAIPATCVPWMTESKGGSRASTLSLPWTKFQP
jgi:hypothetical protein